MVMESERPVDELQTRVADAGDERRQRLRRMWEERAGDPFAQPPDNLVHSPEVFHETWQRLAGLTELMQPLAREAVEEALQSQLGDVGTQALSDESFEAMRSLLSELDNEQDLAQSEAEFRAALRDALAQPRGSLPEPSEDEEMAALNQQAALRAQDLAHVTAIALLDCQRNGEYETSWLKQPALQSIASQGGLDELQLSVYLDRVRTRLARFQHQLWPLSQPVPSSQEMSR